MWDINSANNSSAVVGHVIRDVNLKVINKVDQNDSHVGEELNYTTVITNLGPEKIMDPYEAIFSIEILGLELLTNDITSDALKTSDDIQINASDNIGPYRKYRIANFPMGGTITLTYKGKIIPTASSVINKAYTSLVGELLYDTDEQNNIYAVQTFLKPILVQPSDITICPGQAVYTELKSDNSSFTSYHWAASTSHDIYIKSFNEKGHVISDLINDRGIGGGKVIYTVHPSIQAHPILPSGKFSSSFRTILGDSKTFTVTVKPTASPPTVVARDPTIHYREDAIFTPSSSLPSPTYKWYHSIDKKTQIIAEVSKNGEMTKIRLLPGTYTFYVTVSNSNFCESKVAPVKVFVNTVPIQPPPSLFSPNDDGVNDNWMIENIEQYRQCTVQIFNRWGERVYFSVGYHHPWNGSINGHLLPVGSYYYVIDLKNGTPLIKGSLSLVR